MIDSRAFVPEMLNAQSLHKNHLHKKHLHKFVGLCVWAPPHMLINIIIIL
jgi:hypothetical protein